MGLLKKRDEEEITVDFQNFRDLIPGLPSDLAMECLVRVPYQFHSSMKSVCRSWRSLLSHSSFTRERRRCGKAELLLCLVQPLTPPVPVSPVKSLEAVGEMDGKKLEVASQQRRVFGTRFGLSVYNVVMDTWHRVGVPVEIPLFCECVVLQDVGKVLLIGGWDPETLQPVRDVYVLEFSGSGRRWRRGTPMSEARSFFACSSVGSTKVYVAGGHDDQKNALCSAEVYDVEKDEWSTIPPMAEGRDECQGFAMAADLGFCVLSGYETESQGRFRSDAEIYNPDANSWSKIENAWPFPDSSPRGRIAAVSTNATTAAAARLWCFTDRELESQHRWKTEDDTGKWKLDLETIQLPVKGTSIFAGNVGGEAVVMVGGGAGKTHRGESKGGGEMMTKTAEKHAGKWNHVHIPSNFSSLPFSHASIYI